MPHMTLGQKTRWAYSTMLPSPHETIKIGDKTTLLNRKHRQTTTQI